MCAVEVFVYTRKWVGCTQTVQPRYIKDCGAQAMADVNGVAGIAGGSNTPTKSWRSNRREALGSQIHHFA